MNRFLATLLVLTMALLALIVCIERSIALRQTLGETTSLGLILTGSILAIGVLAAQVALIRSRYSRQLSAVNGSRYGLLQPIRRLVATVWS